MGGVEVAAGRSTTAGGRDGAAAAPWGEVAPGDTAGANDVDAGAVGCCSIARGVGADNATVAVGFAPVGVTGGGGVDRAIGTDGFGAAGVERGGAGGG